MSAALDYSKIFVRYDLKLERGTKEHGAQSDDILKKVVNCVVDGDVDNINALVTEALQTIDPLKVISALVDGMNEVSRLWDEGIYYLPQAIISSDVMLEGVDLCEQKMGKAMEKKGVVVTHTAEGDIHDLGQKIANALLRANGYEVIDLGKDVPVDEVISAVKQYKPIMVTGTALMTTTMTAFEKIASRLEREGVDLPFVCGGGAVSEEYVTGYNLGVWGKDASQAPPMASDAASGKNWRQLREKYNG
ncbi:MAG: cobalamin-dependent protein [Firmicutes bacterium]|nr:cobalamin-dependent protein [Bacillota bacterium]